MADVEFPRRILLRRDLERRPIPDHYRPREVHRARGVELEASDSCAINEIDATNHRKAEGSTETCINQRKTEERLPRRALDEMASLVQALTYGEMLELAEVLWKVQTAGLAVRQENLPELLHRWTKFHSATAVSLKSRPLAKSP